MPIPRHGGLPPLAALGAAALLAACEVEFSDRALSLPDDVRAACGEIATALGSLPATRVSEEEGSWTAFSGTGERQGCVVRAEGPLDAAAPQPVAATSLADSLGAPWMRDPTAVADGPARTAYALWRDDVLCLVRVDWGAAREGPGDPRAVGAGYAATIGCESRPDRSVP